MLSHELAKLLLSMPNVDVIVPRWLRTGGPGCNTYEGQVDVELRDDLHQDLAGIVYNDDDRERVEARLYKHTNDRRVSRIVIY